MTLERTPSMMLRIFGLSVCCETASSDSSSGIDDLTSVASCRVTSDRSDALMPRCIWNENLRPAAAVGCCLPLVAEHLGDRDRQQRLLAQQLAHVARGVAFENALALPARRIDGNV